MVELAEDFTPMKIAGGTFPALVILALVLSQPRSVLAADWLIDSSPFRPAIATNAEALEEALKELDAAQQENDTLYARWAELTEKAG